jgi:translation initiation factor 2 beta subunit (eIF-2beta)/eIF-5
MKMSKSDAGKLGGIKAGITAQDKMQQRIDNYNKSPVVCAECGEAISYEKKI